MLWQTPEKFIYQGWAWQILQALQKHCHVTTTLIRLWVDPEQVPNPAHRGSVNNVLMICSECAFGPSVSMLCSALSLSSY